MQVRAVDGWSVVRADTNADEDERSRSRDGGPRYPYGFFARHLRDYVFEKMAAEGWRQYEVADWLGIPDDALSVYLNRHAHPTPERRRLLARLGCDERELLEVELLDKLDLWMRTHGAGRGDVLRFIERMRAHEAQLARRRARARVSLEALSDSEGAGTGG